MIIYVLMGRALYCPQASKPSQNLCPMPLKYHIFISLALRAAGVESLKSPALSLCLARRGPKPGFCVRAGPENWDGMRMEGNPGGKHCHGEALLVWALVPLPTHFGAQHIPMPEIRESKTCALPWSLTCQFDSLCPEWTEKLIYGLS